MPTSSTCTYSVVGLAVSVWRRGTLPYASDMDITFSRVFKPSRKQQQQLFEQLLHTGT